MTCATTSFNVSALAACGLVIVSNAQAACKFGVSSLSPAALNALVKRPETILEGSGSTMRGARRLSASISQYAATGPAAIEVIKSVLPSATPQQRIAIGEGLFAAVTFCRGINPVVSTQIERAIKSIKDGEVMLAYRRAAGSSAPLTGHASAKTSARGPDLVAKPPVSDPSNLKLSNPFEPPTYGGD